MLWGDYYYQKDKKRFEKKPSKIFKERTFVEFILKPIYKIMGLTVSKEKVQLKTLLLKLGIYLKPQDFKINTKSLLKKVCLKFFGNTSTIIEMVKKFIPTPLEQTKVKVN